MRVWTPKNQPIATKKKDRLSLDFETFLIAPGVQAPPIAAMGFKLASDKRTHVLTRKDTAFRRVLREIFEDRSLLVYGHHFRFDLACALAYEPEWAELIFSRAEDDGFTCTLTRDSIIRVAVANPMQERLKFNLASAYSIYCKNGALDVNKEDPWRQKWGQLAGMRAVDISRDGEKRGAIDYLAIDVEADDEIYVMQEKLYGSQAKTDWLIDEFRQFRAGFILYLMQCWGVRTDPAQVEVLHEQVKRDLDSAAAECEKHGLVINGKRNIAAASAWQEQAYARRGLPVPRNEPTEKAKKAVYVKTQEEELAKGVEHQLATDRAEMAVAQLAGNIILDEEACEKSGDPIMVAYSKTSQASLLLGKVKRLKRPLIQASYNTLVNTGRTSCRQGKDPKKGVAPSAHGSQMQNPPREVLATCTFCQGEGRVGGVKCEPCKGEGEVPVPGVRECFIARPGYVIVSIDFDAFEMRTWAQCCLWMVGYSKLAEILNDPKRCPHVEMGAMIRGLELALCYQWKKEADKRIKPVRNVAKGPNFGLPGGMGAERLVDYCIDSYGVDLDPMSQGDTLEGRERAVAEAKKIIAVWKTIYPEAQPYLDLIGRLVGERGSRTRIVQHFSQRVRGGVGYCDAANTFFQGLAADAAKQSLWAVGREMYAVRSSPLYGSRMLAFVHDELVAEVPMEGLHERCLRLQKLWCGAAQAVVPDVLISASPAAAFRWSKAAGDPVFNAKGELIPYEASPKYAGLPAPEGQMERWLKVA